MTLSLEELYRRHAHVVLRRAAQLLGSQEEAKDVLHDLFLELSMEPNAVRGGTVTGWLYARTTYTCLDRLRRAARRHALATRQLPLTSAPSADELVALRQLFSQLPPELSEIAVYHYLDGMTHEEIAALLGCSRRHIGNQLERIADRAQLEKRTA